MKKPLETAWVGLKVEQERVSGNHQSGSKSVSQVDKSLRYDTHLLACTAHNFNLFSILFKKVTSTLYMLYLMIPEGHPN